MNIELVFGQKNDYLVLKQAMVNEMKWTSIGYEMDQQMDFYWING